MAISREAIESLPRVQKRRRQSTTVDTFIEPTAPSEQPSRATRVVSGLLDLTNRGTEAAVQSEKAKIELDKVTQQQRAIRGLDPTDEATTQGLRAYQVVNMRDQVLEMNSELADIAMENPDMSDEDFEIKTREKYASLVEQYQPDPQLSEALSNELQKSQGQIHQIRTQARRGHEEFLRQDAFQTSVEEYREAAGSPEELAAVMGEDGSLANEADALGITPEQYRNQLVNAAQRDAEVGDGRILSALEQQGWAGNDPRIEKARQVYQRKEAQRNAVNIGSEWGTIQESWKSRQSNWEQTEAAIEDLNSRYPGAVTSNQVASLKQQRAAIDAKEVRTNQLMQLAWGNLQNGDSMRVSLRPDVNDSELKEVALGMSRDIDEHTAQLVEMGEIEEDQSYSYSMGRKLEVSRGTGLKMPEFQRIFSSLSSLDPEDYRSEDGMPDWANQALTTLPQLNESDIERYGANDTTRAFINNYNAMRSTEDADPRAWRKAWQATYGESVLTPTQQSEMITEVDANVDDSLDRSFFEVLTRNRDEVPSHVRNWVGSEARRQSHVLVGSGAADPESAAESGSEIALNNFTILKSGTAVNRKREELIREAATREGELQIRPDELDDSFEWLFGQNMEEMQANSAIDDLTMKDIRFHSRHGGLIMPTDKLGSPLLPAPVTMREIGSQYREAVDSGRVQEALDKARRKYEQSSTPKPRGPGGGYPR